MKKWIFITTCTVGVLLSAVNVYNAQGAWNTGYSITDFHTDDLKSSV